MVDHVTSKYAEQPESDDLAYSRWAETDPAGIAAHTVPIEDDRVLMLHPAEQPVVYNSLTVICGEKQVQTSLEPTTFVLKVAG